nr:hypothetical protein [uncultured Treponema sp.]
MYDVKSARAEDFINDEEILDTLNYSAKHKSDAPLIKSILEKAALCKGISHREAAVLLDCDIPQLNDEIKALAKKSSCVFTETELFFLRRFIFLIIALTRALTALIMFTTNT